MYSGIDSQYSSLSRMCDYHWDNDATLTMYNEKEQVSVDHRCKINLKATFLPQQLRAGSYAKRLIKKS